MVETKRKNGKRAHIKYKLVPIKEIIHTAAKVKAAREGTSITKIINDILEPAFKDEVQ